MRSITVYTGMLHNIAADASQTNCVVFRGAELVVCFWVQPTSTVYVQPSPPTPAPAHHSGRGGYVVLGFAREEVDLGGYDIVDTKQRTGLDLAPRAVPNVRTANSYYQSIRSNLHEWA